MVNYNNNLSTFFYKKSQWEKKRFKHFRQIILSCFPSLQILLFFLIFSWWKDLMKEQNHGRQFSLLMIIIASIVSIFLAYYHWKQLEKCSEKISLIDKEIAGELSKS